MTESVLSTDSPGVFEARYLTFLETITHLRPRLHRYCSRMTGSVLDGEDVVQDTLFQAYRKLDTFDDSQPLGPWLFRIAHNQCISFLRRRGVRQKAETATTIEDFTKPIDPAGPSLNKAIERLVLNLPPKERACVLLKDVFEYTLEDIAETVDSTVGGVKAALKRGRTKLASLNKDSTSQRLPNIKETQLLRLYVERFNQRDWDAVRELISDDAQLRVCDRFAGRLSKSPYFSNYERTSLPWRLMPGEVDGEPAIIINQKRPDGSITQSFVRLIWEDEKISQIVDYSHCPWIYSAADSVIAQRS
jgi:RNA polymerase sigma-70 factor (ECF subfamily)